MSSTDARIALLRQAMSRRGLSAYIVPSSDPHLSEYLPARWQGRRWLSGFTGSVGTLVVTADFAGLWVDSRYWVQAEAQLAGTGVQLMKIALATTPGHVDWLAANTRAGQRIGVDGQVLGLAAFRALSAAAAASGASLEIGADLLDDIWEGRAGRTHASTNTSRRRTVSRADKLAQVREAMRKHGADAHFISTLDDIAWLFNLRGADVDYNRCSSAMRWSAWTTPRCSWPKARWTRPCAPSWPRTAWTSLAMPRPPRRWARWSWTRPC